MDRRSAIALLAGLGASVALHHARAQQAKVYHIAMLERQSKESDSALFNAFRQGLLERGYVEGKNLAIHYRSAEGRDEAYPKLCTEAVRLNVDLIIVRGTPAILACKRTTKTIPILFIGAGDPVGDGLIASLGRPGGNVSGFSNLVVELTAKRLELFREVFPKALHMAALMNMGNPNLPSQWKKLQAAAQPLGIRLTLFDVRKPEDLDLAFERLTHERLDSVYVAQDALTEKNRKRIADLAMKHRLPTVASVSSYVEVGCLVSYGTNIEDLYRRAAGLVDKIFTGTKPADIPVEQPTQLQLAINLKTAKAIDVTIPKEVLFRADKVIQ